MNALIIIDVQNDFCTHGALEVPGGEKIIPLVNSLSSKFEHVLLTQDWHPANHISFASNHPEKSAFDEVKLDYGNQILWPDHCIQGSRGAEFHPDLNTKNALAIIRKGYRRTIDSYSAFFENDRITPTGLHGLLSELGISHVYLCGLATDFCVKFSAIDAIKTGFRTTIIHDAIRGIDREDSVRLAMEEMSGFGVNSIHSSGIIF